MAFRRDGLKFTALDLESYRPQSATKAKLHRSHLYVPTMPLILLANSKPLSLSLSFSLSLANWRCIATHTHTYTHIHTPHTQTRARTHTHIHAHTRTHTNRCQHQPPRRMMIGAFALVCCWGGVLVGAGTSSEISSDDCSWTPAPTRGRFDQVHAWLKTQSANTKSKYNSLKEYMICETGGWKGKTQQTRADGRKSYEWTCPPPAPALAHLDPITLCSNLATMAATRKASRGGASNGSWTGSEWPGILYIGDSLSRLDAITMAALMDAPAQAGPDHKWVHRTANWLFGGPRLDGTVLFSL
jgi:hypothetical protein